MSLVQKRQVQRVWVKVRNMKIVEGMRKREKVRREARKSE